MLDLSQSIKGHTLALDSLPKLSALERNLVENTWRGRMVNEHISSRVFAGLFGQLMQAGMSDKLLQGCSDMIADELRHARQCAAVLVALGADAQAELPTLAPVPNHDEVSRLEAVLRNVLSICCLSETVAVSLINAERLTLTDSILGDVLQKILADEVQHARFGWKMLEDIEIDAEMKERLSKYLRVAFHSLETHELAHLSPARPPSEVACALGACDGEQARSIYFDTMNSIIVPRLEEHGFGAEWAYKNRGLA